MDDASHKRAPRGYRIEQWADGEYHVYRNRAECIAETPSRRNAIKIAWADYETQNEPIPAIAPGPDDEAD